MKCRQCGFLASSVIKTLSDPKVIRRRRLCACGWSWTTREVEEPDTGSFVVTNDREQRPLVTKREGGDISSLDSSQGCIGNQAGARSETDAKSEPYSEAFEVAWKAYGRHEEKVKAYARWKIEAKTAGGEGALCDLVVAALKWQGPLWAADGWKFAKYFERYLKARKWEDQPPPAAPPKPVDSRCAFHRAFGTRGKMPRSGWFDDCSECKHARAGSATRTGDASSTADLLATDRKVAELRKAAARAATPEDLARLRAELETA